jgi:hypothetical protein
MTTLQVFSEEAFKLGIALQPHDNELIKQKFMDPKQTGRVLYEDIIKALVPVLTKTGQT